MSAISEGREGDEIDGVGINASGVVDGGPEGAHASDSVNIEKVEDEKRRPGKMCGCEGFVCTGVFAAEDGKLEDEAGDERRKDCERRGCGACGDSEVKTSDGHCKKFVHVSPIVFYRRLHFPE